MMTRKSDLNTNVFMSHAHPSPEKLPTPEAVGGTLVFSCLFWGIAWVLVFVSFLTILAPLQAIRNATGFLVPLIAPVMVLEYLFRRFFIFPSVFLVDCLVGGCCGSVWLRELLCFQETHQRP